MKNHSGKAEEGQAQEEQESGQISDAARRALAEAEARQIEYQQKEAALPKEIGGRGGREPGRYGDWEVKGLASDF